MFNLMRDKPVIEKLMNWDDSHFLIPESGVRQYTGEVSDGERDWYLPEAYLSHITSGKLEI
jgi:hypothetical protein